MDYLFFPACPSRLERGEGVEFDALIGKLKVEAPLEILDHFLDCRRLISPGPQLISQPQAVGISESLQRNVRPQYRSNSLKPCLPGQGLLSTYLPGLPVFLDGIPQRFEISGETQPLYILRAQEPFPFPLVYVPASIFGIAGFFLYLLGTGHLPLAISLER